MSESTDPTRISAAPSAPLGDIPWPDIPDVVLERELGRGGMGAVWLGRQVLLDRLVAVKAVLTSDVAEFTTRFRREARMLAGLSHPHIVACYHAGVTLQGVPYLVMEFVEGPDLRHYLQQHGPLSLPAALRVAREAALGLGHAAAQGIIHRDVKPENILLAPWPDAPDDFPYQTKVADLGLARPQQAAPGSSLALTQAGQIVGTPATMAPEQFDDPQGVDERADIYGLGCVLFHCLTGKPAFRAPTFAALVASKLEGEAPDPSQLRPGLPPAVRRLVCTLLAPAREQRPHNWAAVQALFTGLALAGAQPHRRRAPWRWLLVMALALFAALWWLWADAAGTGAQQPVALFPPSLPERLAGWQAQGGAQWDADMESTEPGAILGLKGALLRGLPSLPGRLRVQLSVDPGIDGLLVGVTLADGGRAGAYVVELDGSLAGYLGRWEPTQTAPVDHNGGWQGPSALTLLLDIEQDRLRVQFPEQPWATIALPSPPMQLLLQCEQADPAGGKAVRLWNAQWEGGAPGQGASEGLP